MRSWILGSSLIIGLWGTAYGCTTASDEADTDDGHEPAGGTGGNTSDGGDQGGSSGSGGSAGDNGQSGGDGGGSDGSGGTRASSTAQGGASGTSGGGGVASGSGGGAGMGDAGAAGESAGGSGGSNGTDGGSNRPPHQVVWVEDFEGDNDWSVEGGQWEFGTPSLETEPDPLSGSGVAATVIGGNYAENSDALLISPEIVVPEAELLPRLKYAYWYDLLDDWGRVQVRTLGGEWEDVPGHRISQHGTAWAQSIVDLSAYAGETVQVGFRLVSDGSWSGVAEGWYIDDVSFETGAMTFSSPQDFEAGYGDWSVVGGMWAIGTPTAEGEPTPRSGTHLIGTNIGSNYAYGFDTRLVTPEFYVPATADAPKFRYSYAYQLSGGDSGQLQVREDVGEWKDVEGAPITGTAGWSQRIVDLRPYRGKQVQFAFHFVVDDSWSGVGLGWYIDDAALTGF